MFTAWLGLALPAKLPAADPLAIEWAYAAGGTNTVNLRFSRPVNPHTATNLANYQFNNGKPIFNIAPQYGTNLQEYVITTVPLPLDTVLLINSVEDFSHPPEMLFNESTGVQLTDGWVNRSFFGEMNGGAALPGDTLADLIAAKDRFPESPDRLSYSASLESGPGFGSDYGVLMRGYILPPESGDYVFHISAGSQAALYVGSRADVATKRLVAVEPIGSGYRNYLGTLNRTNTDFGNTSFPGIGPLQAVNRSDQTVGPIQLSKGELYYVEIVARFGTEPDHVSVAWKRPGSGDFADGDPPIGRPYLTQHSLASAGHVVIQYTDIPTAVAEGESITMSVQYSGSAPFECQWFRDRQPIPGATNSIYRIEGVTPDMEGASFACRIRNYFSQASTDPHQTAERPTMELVQEGDQRFLVLPAFYWDFIPQSATELEAATEWTDLPGGVLSETEFRIPIAAGPGQRFFRAMKALPAP